MIIPRVIEAFYGRAAESVYALAHEIDQTLGNMADSLGIMYVKARTKPKESFMAKVEKQGWKKPTEEIDDLVACRLVVSSSAQIDPVLERIEEVFNVEKRSSRTYRSPTEFIYDDIHLVLTFRDGPYLVNKDMLGKRFELQIRTALQDALAEVIRGEIYKTDTLTWQKERTASELRANLELVDLILSDFMRIAALHEEKDYVPYRRRNETIQLLRELWGADRLPQDLRRASIVIEEYLRLAESTAQELREWLMAKHANLVKAVSITPCQAILIVLFLEKARFLNNVKRENRCLLITEEMTDICPSLATVDESSRVRIDE